MSEGQLVDSIKKFVPGEILAAYIALDSFIPYSEDVERWLSPIAIVVLSFFLGVLVYRREPKARLITAVGVVLLFVSWCALISLERVSNIADIYAVKAAATVLIILLSTGFVLFDVQSKDGSEKGAAAKG